MDTRFDQLSHAKIRLLFHVVLATKYQRRVLDGVEQKVYESVGECASVSDFDVLRCGIDHGDHMHLLVRITRGDVSIGQVVRRIKQFTTNDLYDDEDICKRLRLTYKGRKRKLWSSGYFAATAGNDVSVVDSYIAQQAR